MSKVVLAIVGLPGAGKTEAIKYVVEKTGWPKVYFGNSTFDELKKQGLKVNEVNERKVREELREKFGMAAFAILSLSKIKKLYRDSSVILESLYSWEEYEVLSKEYKEAFMVLAIYASPRIRKQRLVTRRERPLTVEEFVSRDYSQIANLHQAGPIARADYIVINEGTFQDLRKNLDQVLKKIKNES